MKGVYKAAAKITYELVGNQSSMAEEGLSFSKCLKQVFIVLA